MFPCKKIVADHSAIQTDVTAERFMTIRLRLTIATPHSRMRGVAATIGTSFLKSSCDHMRWRTRIPLAV